MLVFSEFLSVVDDLVVVVAVGGDGSDCGKVFG